MKLTKKEAIQHLKDLCKMYPNTYGHWDKLPYASKQEDWDSYKDTLFRDGHITVRH